MAYETTELQEICDSLNGYSRKWEVLAARKRASGEWQLMIKKINQEEKENQEGAENDNQ